MSVLKRSLPLKASLPDKRERDLADNLAVRSAADSEVHKPSKRFPIDLFHHAFTSVDRSGSNKNLLRIGLCP